MKETKGEFLRRSSGITLVALVVTIVILIILATISVSVVLGEGGLIKQAKDAAKDFKDAQEKEKGDMNLLAQEYANIMAENNNIENGGGEDKPQEPEIPKPPRAGDVMDKPSNWTSTKVTPINNGKNVAIPLPDGFYYVGGDIDSGIVISDNSSDANKGTSYTTASTLKGNQFVWIPVASEADLARTNFDSNGKPTSGLYTDYEEPSSWGYDTEIADFNTMKEQVLQYNGFYIGRYEMGDGTVGTKLRTSETDAHTVVCKKGVAPYNYIPWGQSISNIGNETKPSGAAYLSKNMYAGKMQAESVTSTLCYGSQWDAMCRYIGDANRTTPGKVEPELTGSVETDVSKNIYDLAGNCYEWTMELDTYDHYMRVHRGRLLYIWSVSFYPLT